MTNKFLYRFQTIGCTLAFLCCLIKIRAKDGTGLLKILIFQLHRALIQKNWASMFTVKRMKHLSRALSYLNCILILLIARLVWVPATPYYSAFSNWGEMVAGGHTRI